MRPINKGMSPYTEITKYQQAEPYLEERLGRYCSFCEMRVNHHLAVEHKESKKSGGALTDWDNLLLACSYCNSRKLEKIKKGDIGKWIWPDQDNTFLAFTYENAVPKLNKKYLDSIGTEAYKRAKAVFDGLALDYCPESSRAKNGKKHYADKRWASRFEAWTVAEESKRIWTRCKDQESKSNQKTNIVLQAKGYGFFSVWMMVFHDVEEIKMSLIKAFPGTSEECFDDKGNPRRRDGGII